jgi:SAM-dependent methyltransferase
VYWPDAADHLGRAYLRYSFTKGTEQEVAFLIETLGLGPHTRVLDVGCGPGRHARALAARGIPVHGVDIAPAFVDLARQDAPPGATFEVADARDLNYDNEFDVVMSLCQGGFGLMGEDDGAILANMARAAPRVVFSAFSAYFALRYLEDSDMFDAASGVNRENATLKSEAGDERDFLLETSVFTPRELRLMCRAAGLTVDELWSVTPGDYAARPPDLDHPEWLALARHMDGHSPMGASDLRW